jgi:hypothetical protein
MAKKSGATEHDLEIAKFLRLGGRKIPARFTAKARAAMKSMLLQKLDAGTDLRIQGARLYGDLNGKSAIAVDDPRNRETLDAILRLHRKFANKKVPFPKVSPQFGAFPPGTISFSGTVVPPFE